MKYVLWIRKVIVDLLVQYVEDHIEKIPAQIKIRKTSFTFIVIVFKIKQTTLISIYNVIKL